MSGNPLLCGIAVLIAVGCGPKPVASTIAPPTKTSPVVARRTSGFQSKAKDPMLKTDPAEAMRHLRLRALATRPAELGLAPSPEFPRVYGVLMEQPIGKAIATVVSFATGDASLYTSAGFGIIGGVAHERVRVVARRLVSLANRDYDVAVPTEAFPRPDDGRVRFILLGYKGRRVIEGNLPSPSGSGTAHDLFAAGQSVLTELRQISQATER